MIEQDRKGGPMRRLMPVCCVLFCALLVSNAFSLLTVSYQGPSNVHWDVCRKDGKKEIIPVCMRGGRCTGENLGPRTVVFTVQYEDKDGKWVTRSEVAVNAKDKKDFEVKPDDRVLVSTLAKSGDNVCAKGFVTIPW